MDVFCPGLETIQPRRRVFSQKEEVFLSGGDFGISSLQAPGFEFPCYLAYYVRGSRVP